MGNDHLMYYSDSVKCDIKVEFEDWESKFTPAGWRASGLFDTLEGKTINNSLRLSLLPLETQSLWNAFAPTECCGGKTFFGQNAFVP
jgi:hypothetical protein